MHNPFITIINSLLPEPQASLLNGILFGVKTSMSPALYQALIDTGTLHIIALSGMNISILITLVGKTTLFLGRKFSGFLTIVFIILFVWFVGASPSLIRAAIMGFLSLFALYSGRVNWAILTLFLAGLIMLLFNFDFIKDLSFQLSFLATLGIILVSSDKKKFRKNPIDNIIYSIKENFKITLAAQIFTLPVILINFHRLSIIAPIANLLIVWAIQPIMIFGFITGILGLIWLPLGVLSAWMVWTGLTYIITAVEWLGKVPGASVEF